MRVTAVRKLTQYVRVTGLPVVGLAPEGMDHPSGHLSMPPHGSGKLIWYLSKQGLAILPVGIFEQDRALRFQIGPVTQIESMAVTDHEILDQKVALKAMEAISACLPTSFPSAISLHLDRE